MGICVDLNREVDRQEKLTGRTLGDNEVRQLRYNAGMREAAKLQGAAAAAAGTAEGQSKALAREVIELKEAIGAQFQGYLRSWVGHLRELVGFLKDNSTLVVKLAEGVLVLAAALGTVTVAMRAFKVAAVGFEAIMVGIAMIKTVSFAIGNGLTGALVGAEVALAAVARLIPPVAAGLADKAASAGVDLVSAGPAGSVDPLNGTDLLPLFVGPPVVGRLRLDLLPHGISVTESAMVW